MPTNVVSVYGGVAPYTRIFFRDGVGTGLLSTVIMLVNGVLTALLVGMSATFVSGTNNTQIQIVMPSNTPVGDYEVRLPINLVSYAYVTFRVESARPRQPDGADGQGAG